MASIRFKTVDVDGAQIFLWRGPSDQSSGACPASWFSHFKPHVQQPDPAALRNSFISWLRTCQDSAGAQSASGISFAKIADIISHFTERVGLNQFAIYIFDYGAPTGLRLALKYPAHIKAIVAQNGNAYQEKALARGRLPIGACRKEPSQANRDAVRALSVT